MAPRLVRWSDFVALPEDDRRELVDGRLEAFDIPTKWHERICLLLGRILDEWAETRGFVVLGSGYKVKVTETRGAVPDVQLLTEESYEAAGDTGMEHGRPELVIEVVSPGSKKHDRFQKLDWYAQLGVPEYWLVEPEERSLTAHHLQGRVYAIVQHAQGDEVLKSKHFKGLKVPLARLWTALPKK